MKVDKECRDGEGENGDASQHDDNCRALVLLTRYMVLRSPNSTMKMCLYVCRLIVVRTHTSRLIEDRGVELGLPFFCCMDSRCSQISGCTHESSKTSKTRIQVWGLHRSATDTVYVYHAHKPTHVRTHIQHKFKEVCNLSVPYPPSVRNHSPCIYRII